MFLEPYGGLLIGSILTLVISIITMFLTHYFSDKRWYSQKEFEQKKQTIEEVYSPLYFLLEDTLSSLRFLNGYFNTCIIKKRERMNKKDLSIINREINKIKSKSLQNLIEKKLGVLKPAQFQEDLLLFLGLLENLEWNLKQVSEIEKGSLLKTLQNYAQALAYYIAIIENFQEFLEEEVLRKEKDIDKIEYEKILSLEQTTKVTALIEDTPDDPDYLKYEQMCEQQEKKARKDLDIG